MAVYSNKLFKNPIEIIEAQGDEIKAALSKIEELKNKYYLLGYINYDFTQLYFEAYESYEEFIPKKIDKPLGIIKTPLISKEDYFNNIEKNKRIYLTRCKL